MEEIFTCNTVNKEEIHVRVSIILVTLPPKFLKKIKRFIYFNQNFLRTRLVIKLPGELFSRADLGPNIIKL